MNHKLFINVTNVCIIFTLFFLLLILSGGRTVEVGTDTLAYYEIFNIINLSNYPPEAIRWEPLYVYLNEFVYYFGGDARHVLFISNALILYIVFYLIKKESVNIYLSLVLYVCIFGYLFSFNVVRQSVAIAFFVIAIYQLNSNQKMQSLFFFIISVLFHYSAIVTICIFLFFYFFMTKKSLLFLWLVSLLAIISKDFTIFIFMPIINILAILFGDYYIQYLDTFIISSNISLKVIFFQLLFVLYYYVLVIKIKASNFFNMYVYLAMIGIIFNNYFFYIELLQRFVVYFEIFNIIALPYALKLIFFKQYKYLYLSIIMVVVTFSFSLLLRSLSSGSNGIINYSNWIINF